MGIVVTVLTILLSLAALITAIYSAAQSRRQGVAAIRSELLGYARTMGTLDREAGRVNGHQIGMIGQQVDVLIDEYGQDNLQLPASYFRIVADQLALASDDTILATKFCDIAESLLATEADPLESIRLQRVRGRSRREMPISHY